MKTIEYDGLRFVRDDRTGYYLNSKTGKRLHRYVWEKHNGEIPNGYEVHHIDRDKDNNDIENLQLLSKKEHMMLHGTLLTEDERQRRRANFNDNARPAAIEWHKSQEGREWHKTQYERMKECLHEKKELKCLNCGKTYYSERGAFCCNACKSAYRRKLGADDETRICVYCGKEFSANKYSKITHCSRTCTMKDRHRKANTP